MSELIIRLRELVVHGEALRSTNWLRGRRIVEDAQRALVLAEELERRLADAETDPEGFNLHDPQKRVPACPVDAVTKAMNKEPRG